MIIQVYDDDLLNGDGIREVVFFRGCHHKCKGCFNSETQEFYPETEESIKQTDEFIKRISKKLCTSYIHGVTLSGGDPLAPENLQEAERVIQIAKSLHKTVWVYTGYLWENIQHLNFLDKIDVLIDGPFIEKLKSPNKPWVGSSNQRVIDVKQSLKKGKVIEYTSVV